MNIRTHLLFLFCLCNMPFVFASEVISNDDNSAYENETLLLVGDTIIYDTLSLDLGEIRTRCLDTSMLTGPIDTIYNECSNNFSPAVNFLINPEFNCSTTIKYQGVTCGTDTACFVICDVNGICETHTLIVSALEPDCFPQTEYHYDTLFVGESADYCINTNELSGAVLTFENVCESSGGTSAVFSTYEDNGQYCVNYAAVNVGVDTACLVVVDDRGFSDTTCVIISSLVPKTTTICDTLKLGTDTLYCLVNDEIGGNVDAFMNVCPEFSDTSVIFTPNNVTLCVETQAIGLGTDSACVIICNENDICDTTFFKIVVIPDPADSTEMEPPVAVNDTVSTEENTPLIISVTGNDTIPGTKVLFEILTLPIAGIATEEADCNISYTPDNDFCGIDSLEYRICNTVGCDTAWVLIDVQCTSDTLIIYNGISPGGSEANNTWVIKGIENYPENNVKVINRWGNSVFEMDGYRNSWDGTWNEMYLPDGTYYYLIDLGNGERFNGFLQINR